MYLHFLFFRYKFNRLLYQDVRTLDAASFTQRNLDSLNTSQKFLNRNLNIVLTSIFPANNIGGPSDVSITHSLLLPYGLFSILCYLKSTR